MKVLLTIAKDKRWHAFFIFAPLCIMRLICSMTPDDTIYLIELRRLLYTLKDRRKDILIRFRMLGEMWQPYHLRVFDVTEKGVILKDTFGDKTITVYDLDNVMQFEIDSPLHEYHPHFHYKVVRNE